MKTEMRCVKCNGHYFIDTMGGVRPDQLILSIHERCAQCGSHLGTAVCSLRLNLDMPAEEWPEFIDA